MRTCIPVSLISAATLAFTPMAQAAQSAPAAVKAPAPPAPYQPPQTVPGGVPQTVPGGVPQTVPGGVPQAVPSQPPPAAPYPPASPYPPAPGAPPYPLPPGYPGVPGAASHQPYPPRYALGVSARIASPRPEAVLQQKTAHGWQIVCDSFCAGLDPQGTYRISGRGVRTSGAFSLPQGGRSLVIEVDPGSGSRYFTGMGLSLGGFLHLGLGVLYVLAGNAIDSSSTSYDYYSDSYRSTNDGAREALIGLGVISLVLGGVLEAIGMPMWLGNRTKVRAR